MVNSSLYDRLFNGRPALMGGSRRSNFMKLVNEKKAFLMSVFANLITQLGITYYVMMNYNSNNNSNNKSSTKNTIKTSTFYIIVIVQVAIIFALALLPMPSWIKFIVFSIFSALWGVLFSDIQKSNDGNLIQMAIFGTMGIFGTMFLIGALLLFFGIQLGFGMATFLFYSLLLLIIAQLVMMFVEAYSIYMKILSAIGLFIFSLYIIYDTNNILQRDYKGDFITASMDYYLDILNIFLNLTNLEQ